MLSLVLTVTYLIAAMAAALAFYLATQHQKLRPVPASWQRPLRGLGWTLLVLAWLAGTTSLGVWAGCFASLTAFMLSAVLLPYLDALRQSRTSRKENHVG